jgi:hypothetical protein
VALVLIVGAAAAYVLTKRYEARDIQGSSTEEFFTTEPATTEEEPGFVYSSPAVWRLRVYAGSHDRFVVGYSKLYAMVRR